MSQIIPLGLILTPRKDYLVELEGKDYRLDLTFNPRGQFWMMDVYNAAGELLAAGQKLAGNARLLGLFDNPELPPGQFWVVDVGGQKRDPDRSSLGNGVQLMYREAGNNV